MRRIRLRRIGTKNRVVQNADPTSPYSELAREKMWSRIHLIPMLQAEEDRDQVRRHLADKARERELLGAETKVYNSDRYARTPPCLLLTTSVSYNMSRFVRPTFAVTPNEVTK